MSNATAADAENAADVILEPRLRTQTLARLSFVGASLASITLVLLVTRGRPGLTVDSGEYVNAARSLIHGHGLGVAYSGVDEAFRVPHGTGQYAPLTQFPPLFSLLIAVVASLGRCSAVTAAGVVSALSYAWVSGRLARAASRHGFATALAVTAAVGVLPIVEPAMMAWAEPLKLLLMVECAFAVARFWSSGRRADLLTVCSWCVLASISHLTGVAAAIGAAGCMLLLGRAANSAGPNVGRSACILAAGTAPTLLWIGYGLARSGGVSQKRLGWHPTVESGLWWSLALLVLAATIAAFSLRHRRVLPLAMTVMAGASIVVLLSSRTFLDRNISLDRRQLQAAAVLTAYAAISVVSVRASARVLMPVLATILVAVGPGLTLLSVVHVRSSEFLGYSAPRWKHSEVLAGLAQRPRSAWTLTNAPDALSFLARTTPIGLPLRTDLYTGTRNGSYTEQLDALRCAVNGHRAALAFFYRPTRGHFRLPDDALVDHLRLGHARRFNDGVVFDIDTGGCS